MTVDLVVSLLVVQVGWTLLVYWHAWQKGFHRRGEIADQYRPYPPSPRPPRSGTPILSVPPRKDETRSYMPTSGPETPAPWGAAGPAGKTECRCELTYFDARQVR